MPYPSGPGHNGNLGELWQTILDPVVKHLGNICLTLPDLGTRVILVELSGRPFLNWLLLKYSRETHALPFLTWAPG